jgi:hypothetical protein
VQGSEAATKDAWDRDRGFERVSLLEPQAPPLWEASLAAACPALYCAQRLLASNYAVLDNFLDEDEVEQLREEVRDYERGGRMKYGEIGTGASASTGALRRDMRDDIIVWFEGREPWVRAGMRKHILRMDVFAQKLSLLMEALSPEEDWAGAGRSKIMATVYKGKEKARYVPHYDNPNRNGRKLTTIVYLNKEWVAGDGGVLRIKTDCKIVDVAPLGGRLLCFWSDRRCPHEVQPTANPRRDRYAITIWYLDAKERQEAESRQRRNIADADAAAQS